MAYRDDLQALTARVRELEHNQRIVAEARQQGLAAVTEVSESGSVPTLLLDNTADEALFLLDGEELIGAKQNRILNTTILIAAGST